MERIFCLVKEYCQNNKEIEKLERLIVINKKPE